MNNNFIKDYIGNYIKQNTLSKKTIKDYIFLLCFIGIPTSFLGVNKGITIPIIAIILFLQILWSLLLLKGKCHKQYILYSGISCEMLSIILLITSYKIISLCRNIQVNEIILVLVLYISFIIIYNVIFINKISKEKYVKKKNNTSCIFLASVLGIVIGKSIFSNMNNNQVIIIVGLMTLLIALVLAIGTKMVLIYYIAEKHGLLE